MADDFNSAGNTNEKDEFKIEYNLDHDDDYEYGWYGADEEYESSDEALLADPVVGPQKEEREIERQQSGEEEERQRVELEPPHKIPCYTIGDFKNLRPIEIGNVGNTHIARLDKFGKIALKQFRCQSSTDLYKKEIEILITHRHQNIVQLYGILWNSGPTFSGYVMEYIEDGSLHDMVHDPTKDYDLTQIFKWIQQIGRGLQFLHDNDIIHRDIKLKNILITGNHLKLADFGIAKSMDIETTARTGTLRYMAPEAIEGKYSLASDIYSLGITIWEIFHRKIPYSELEGYTLASEVVNGMRPAIEPDKMGHELTEFLKRCWAKNAEIRPKINEILAFVKNEVDHCEEITSRLCHFTTEERQKEYVSKQTGDTILIIGLSQDLTASFHMIALSSDRSTWNETQMKIPHDIGGGGVVYLDDEIYIIGGDSHPDDLYKLDKNLKWIKLAAMNNGRTGITRSCLAWNGYIWVFGGENKQKEVMKSVERYDPKMDKWTIMPDMEHSRSNAVAAYLNDKIFISGGSINRRGRIPSIVESYPADSQMEQYFWTIFVSDPTLLHYKGKLIQMEGFGKYIWEIDADFADRLQAYQSVKCKRLPPMKNRDDILIGSRLDNPILTVLDDEIYAIIRPISRYLCQDPVEIFDGKCWRDGPSLPCNIHCMSALTVPQSFADRLLAHNKHS